MSIKDELEGSKKYSFTMIPGAENSINNKYGLLDLTPENVYLVEAMIRTDSAYSKSFDLNDGNTDTKGNVNGSTAYCMKLFKDYLGTLKPNDKLGNKQGNKILDGVIAAVDRENSTHLNGDKAGREVVRKRLGNLTQEEFWTFLKNEDEKYELFDLIAKKTSKKAYARQNPAFASKFCHYACMNLFEENEDDLRDRYSIYDRILRTIVPYYANHFDSNIPTKPIIYRKLENYKNYCTLIDFILEKSGNKISRNGFDHLLWYYYKGRIN